MSDVVKLAEGHAVKCMACETIITPQEAGKTIFGTACNCSFIKVYASAGEDDTILSVWIDQDMLLFYNQMVNLFPLKDIVKK